MSDVEEMREAARYQNYPFRAIEPSEPRRYRDSEPPEPPVTGENFHINGVHVGYLYPASNGKPAHIKAIEQDEELQARLDEMLPRWLAEKEEKARASKKLMEQARRGALLKARRAVGLPAKDRSKSWLARLFRRGESV